MKKTQIAFTCLALLFALISFGRAQTSDDDATSVVADEMGLQLLSADAVPFSGTFWTVTTNADSIIPPFPCLLPNANLPVYQISAGQFLVDNTMGDTGLDPMAIIEQAAAVSNLITQVQATATAQASRMTGIHALDDSGPPSFSDTNDDGGNYYTNLLSLPPINTNLLWLQITNVANGLAYLNLNKATDSVYAIFGTTNLLTPFTNWQVVAEVWPTNETTNVLPFTVETDNNTNLFWQAEDWTGVEINGLPAWWTWLYFGNTDESAANLDSLGNTFLYDYQHHLDPNIIEFGASATNYYVNQSAVPVQIALIAGVPSYYVVLVNNTNEADAVWQDYTGTNLVVELGSTNGNYNVWIGLKGFATNATQTWDIDTLPLTLEAVPPVLTITNPTTSTVTQDMIQVQGYANEGLSSLTFDVSNATGIFTNQTGLLTGQFYDTNLLAYTTNYFECDNVALNSGSNLVTLHATDWAGNTANVSRLLDYVPDTNPPTISLIWPQAGTSISGSNFTVQAEVNEPAVTVAATVNGTTVPGLVEQGGMAWAQNLLLMAGTNMVTLTASNSFGGVSATNFNVIGSDVGLVIDPLPGNELNQASVSVTGSVGNMNDTVTVNGVAAYLTDDNGDWEADNVPVNPAGTANLNVQVSDANGNPLTSQNTYQSQPPTVALMSYFGQSSGNGVTIGAGWSQGVTVYSSGSSAINWSYSTGGNLYSHSTTIGGDPENPPVTDYDESLAPATNGVGAITPPFENAQVNYSSADSLGTSSGNYSITTQVMIQPSGQQAAGQTNVYLVLACASEVADTSYDNFLGFDSLISYAPSWWYGTIPLAPDRLQIQGQTLINTGETNTDGSFWGAALVSAPSGMNTDVTPVSLDGVRDYTFYEQATNVTLQILDANNGNANLSSQTNTVIVGQQMNLICRLSVTNAFMTNFPLSNFQWTVPGYAISNYIVAPDESSEVVYTNFAINNTNVIFYWVDGATNCTVQCSAKVNGMAITGQAIFNVYSPIPTNFSPAIVGVVAADTNYAASPDLIGYPFIHFGIDFITNFGIAFNLANAPVQYWLNATNPILYGDYNMTQIINNSSVEMNVISGTNIEGEEYDESGLDTHLNLNNKIMYAVGSTGFQWGDSPAQGLGEPIIWEKRSDSFVSYLMFQPNSPNSIRVPMKMITWGWSGAALTNGTPSGYNLTSSSITNPIVYATENFPVWTNVVSGIHLIQTNLPPFNEN